MEKTRRDLLRVNSISTLKRAYVVVKEKGYSVKDCSVQDELNIVTKHCNNFRKSNDGGDYTYYLNMIQVSPCIFKVKEDWSCGIDVIDNYVNYNGYLVMSAKDLEMFLSLPTY